MLGGPPVVSPTIKGSDAATPVGGRHNPATRCKLVTGLRGKNTFARAQWRARPGVEAPGVFEGVLRGGGGWGLRQREDGEGLRPGIARSGRRGGEGAVTTDTHPETQTAGERLELLSPRQQLCWRPSVPRGRTCACAALPSGQGNRRALSLPPTVGVCH